jgi:hypothetical protein
MAKAYFTVRSVVDQPLRQRFDHWYSTDHLPRALSDFAAEKCWRLWSTVEPGAHYAVYQFADMSKLETAMQSDAFKELVADYDRNWPAGVTRTRDIVSLVEELGAQ